jgi:hypothetical protein
MDSHFIGFYQYQPQFVQMNNCRHIEILYMDVPLGIDHLVGLLNDTKSSPQGHPAGSKPTTAVQTTDEGRIEGLQHRLKGD